MPLHVSGLCFSCIEEEISKCSQQVQDNYRKAIKAETTVIEEVCTPGEAQDGKQTF